jgi:uncharacterized protein YndB with AHSA1/START domain
MSTYPHHMTLPTDREIHVERVLNAPRAKVWRAYTEPALVARWWGRGNPVDVEAMEVWPGGRWRFVERSADGTFTFHGEYREVTPIERIVQTLGWDGMPGHTVLEHLQLEDLGDGRTRLVARSQFASAEDRDQMIGYGMEAGMAESYAALDRLLAELD